MSVLGAFWIEDYRHNQQEYEDYVNVLINFRNDVNADVIEFKFQVDTTIRGGGTYIYNEQALSKAFTVINDNDPKNDYQVFNLIQEGNWVTIDWRYPSAYYDILADYSTFLIEDSLISSGMRGSS